MKRLKDMLRTVRFWAVLLLAAPAAAQTSYDFEGYVGRLDAAQLGEGWSRLAPSRHAVASARRSHGERSRLRRGLPGAGSGPTRPAGSPFRGWGGIQHGCTSSLRPAPKTIQIARSWSLGKKY